MIKYFTLIIFYAVTISAQNSDSAAGSFVYALINRDNNLKEFVLPAELQASERLGITYFETKFKFLISDDIDRTNGIKLKNNKSDYEYDIKELGNDYSILNLRIPSADLFRQYYFYKSRLISKPLYYALPGLKLPIKNIFRSKSF